MNKNYLNIYNNLIKLTRNKTLYANKSNSETFSDRLILFLLHFAFFLKSYKDQNNKKIFQELYDFVFRQIELSIREVGYGDATINKRMKDYVSFLYFVIDKVELWGKLDLNEKSEIFSKYLKVHKESSFYIDYFDKYAVYLSKNSFNYFTKDVISLKI